MQAQEKMLEVFKFNLEAEIRNVVSNAIQSVTLGIKGGAKFEEIVKNTKEKMHNLGCSIIENVCEQIDNLYDVGRNRHDVVQRHKCKTRRLISEMGEITLSRRFYQDKRNSENFYVVDRLLGIPKNSRIEEGLKRKVVQTATKSSYGRAAAVADNKISRQTVCNLVHSVDAKSLSLRQSKRTVAQELFIEADEDHIHLNDGTSAEVKLVYVHEGRERVCKGRTRLKNCKYLTFVDTDAYKVWSDVTEFLSRNYSLRNTKLHVSGDGAAWIRLGTEFFPQAQFHLDKFHVFQAVTRSSNGDRGFMKKYVRAVKQGDLEYITELYKSKVKEVVGIAERKRILENYTYIKNNFDSIDLTGKYFCCAEGHVSHVLSARMSSRPMGWSIKGARSVAALRAYMFNGGDFDRISFCTDNLSAQNVLTKCTDSPSTRKYNSLCSKAANKNYTDVFQTHIPGIERRNAFGNLLREIICRNCDF